MYTFSEVDTVKSAKAWLYPYGTGFEAAVSDIHGQMALAG